MQSYNTHNKKLIIKNHYNITIINYVYSIIRSYHTILSQDHAKEFNMLRFYTWTESNFVLNQSFTRQHGKMHVCYTTSHEGPHVTQSLGVDGNTLVKALSNHEHGPFSHLPTTQARFHVCRSGGGVKVKSPPPPSWIHPRSTHNVPPVETYTK